MEADRTLVRPKIDASAECHCGSRRIGRDCCLASGFPWKIVRVRTPVSQTGYSHSRCYRRHTKDCSPGISGEHPISRNVLKELSAPTVLVDGVPWLAVGERREMPITALESNILCARHNAAFSDLDAEAGLFVKKIKEIRTTNREFLSSKKLIDDIEWRGIRNMGLEGGVWALLREICSAESATSSWTPYH